MSGIEKIPLIIPEQWDASWYRRHVAEVLSKLDTRNSVGDGIVVSSDGNSVATLSATSAISTAINTHKLETDPHPDIIDEVPAASSVAASDLLLVSQSGTNKRATVTQTMQAHRDETDPHPDLIDDLTAVTAVAEADYVLVSQSGTNKKATVDQLAAAVFGDDWDDIRFPASQIDPVGLAAPATRITSLTGYTGGLEFAGNAENVCGGIAQMPHEWARTALKPHIHWTKPTGSANAVTWNFYYRIIGNPGDTAEAWSTAQSVVATIGDPTVSDEHLISTFPDIDMTGYIESAIVYWRLHRLGNTDADNNAVVLHELDFHFQKNKAGTPDAIPVP